MMTVMTNLLMTQLRRNIEDDDVVTLCMMTVLTNLLMTQLRRNIEDDDVEV